MDSLFDLTDDDWRNFALNVAAGLFVALLLWLVAKSRGRLTPLGDTAKIKRPVNNLPKPTEHYVEDKSLIVGIYRAMKDRKGATISGLSGMGGIGKTEAAIVASWHLLQDGRFRDGAVMINLRGFSKTAEPVTPEQGLAQLIAALTGKITPTEATAEQLSGVWQQATAGKDLLVILDNARDAAQIEHLMPSSNGPKVLVTSRNKVQLPGGREPIEVGKLDTKRATRLIRDLAPDLDPAQTARLLKLSLGLPLLLETLAKTVQRPEKTVDVWLTELEEHGAAAQGEDIAQVRARLAFSIDALGADDAAQYAALSLCPAGFHAKTAYAIWGQDETAGPDTLRRLRDASLLEDAETPFAEALGPRYVLHDYLSDAAREHFVALDGKTRQGYQHRWGQVALKLLATAEQIYKTKDSHLVGLRLFGIEQATIRAAQAWAAEKADGDDVAADLAMRFPNLSILDLRLTPRERIGWLEAGVPASKRLGDRAAEAALLGNAGHRYRVLGEFGAAEERLNASLAIEEERGNRLGMAQDHGNLGNLYREKGDLDAAEESLKASLEISEALSEEASARGDEAGKRAADVSRANQYGSLGSVYLEQEKYAEAERSYRASLDISERLGMREVSARNYGNLGILYREQDRLDDAATACEQALEINTELNRRDGMATTNFNLAILRMQRGQIAVARKHAETARDLYAEMGIDQNVTKAEQLLDELNNPPT